MNSTEIAIYSAIIQGLAILAILGLFGSMILVPMSLSSAGHTILSKVFSDEREPMKWALAIASVAMIGSLYLSEIVGFVPCRLCWFQRGVMYPLVPILAVMIWRRYSRGWMIVLPLGLVGASISALHIFEQFNPEMELVPCGSGVPCSARYVAVFGWVSIPVLAGAAFLTIASLMLVTGALRRHAKVSGTPEPE